MIPKSTCSFFLMLALCVGSIGRAQTPNQVNGLHDSLRLSQGETATVSIANGRYDFSEMPGIVVPDGATLTVIGDGEVTLTGSRNRNLFVVDPGGSINLRNIKFENWWMPVFLRRGKHKSVHVENCEFNKIENSAGTIYVDQNLEGIDSFVFRSNLVTNSARHGVRLGLKSGATARHFEISNNVIDGVRGSRTIMAIGFVQPNLGNLDSSILIHNNTVRNLYMEPDKASVYMGIYCQGENVSISGNTVTKFGTRMPNPSAGIYVNADNATVHGNNVSQTGTDGILFKQSKAVCLSSNTVDTCSNNSIRVEGGETFSITGNTFRNCPLRAAWLNMSDSIFSGNIVDGCATTGKRTGAVLFINSSDLVCSSNVIKTESETPPIRLRYTIDGENVLVSGNILKSSKAPMAVRFVGNAGRTLRSLRFAGNIRAMDKLLVSSGGSVEHQVD